MIEYEDTELNTIKINFTGSVWLYIQIVRNLEILWKLLQQVPVKVFGIVFRNDDHITEIMCPY